MAVRHGVDHAGSLGRPAVQPGHLRASAGLVDEDEGLRIEAALPQPPSSSRPRDVRRACSATRRTFLERKAAHRPPHASLRALLREAVTLEHAIRTDDPPEHRATPAPPICWATGAADARRHECGAVTVLHPSRVDHDAQGKTLVSTRRGSCVPSPACRRRSQPRRPSSSRSGRLDRPAIEGSPRRARLAPGGARVGPCAARPGSPSQVPSPWSLRKMLRTVDRGGKSPPGLWRQGQPARRSWKIAFMTACEAVLRGRPPGLAREIGGPGRSHSDSRRLLGKPRWR